MSVNFLCDPGTFRQLPPNFHGSADLPSTFPASVGPSVCPWYLLSTFRETVEPCVNFPCVHGNFCQHFVLVQDLR